MERKDDASLYKNNEISNLILGLGLGLKGEDVTNLRYGKVSVHVISKHPCSLWHLASAIHDLQITRHLHAGCVDT